MCLDMLRHAGWDVYSIASPHSRRWLPSASVGSPSGVAVASGGQRFYLEQPSSGMSLSSVTQFLTGSAASTITLADLKKRIAEMEAEIQAGDGSEEYRQCVLEKYWWEGEVRYNKAQLATRGGRILGEGQLLLQALRPSAGFRRVGRQPGSTPSSLGFTGLSRSGETAPTRYAGMFQLDGGTKNCSTCSTRARCHWLVLCLAGSTNSISSGCRRFTPSVTGCLKQNGRDASTLSPSPRPRARCTSCSSIR